MGIRREVVYRDAGGERPATADEENEVFEALAGRRAGMMEESAPVCLRCGRKAAEHERPYPVRGSIEGSIYFDCWTPEERERILPPDSPT